MEKVKLLLAVSILRHGFKSHTASQNIFTSMFWWPLAQWQSGDKINLNIATRTIQKSIIVIAQMVRAPVVKLVVAGSIPAHNKIRGVVSRLVGAPHLINKQAIIDANVLNTSIYTAIRKRKVNNILETTDSILFSKWIDQYKKLSVERNLKPNTLRTRNNILDQVDKVLGSIPIREITVKHCAELISRYLKENKNRMAQSVRSTLIDCFKDAMAAGEADTNPAAVTRNPLVIVRRSRLTTNEFKAIVAAAEQSFDPWVSNAMLLALVTGQTREDLTQALKTKPANWDKLYTQYLEDKVNHKNPVIPPSFVDNGHYHATRRKTGALIKIPLSLHLEAIGLSVGDVINRCNDRTFSRHILHHTKKRTTANVGDAIHPERMSKRFADDRDRSGLTWPGNPPTFHEIRSLSERLYKKQGINTKDLLGHRQERTTAIYNNARGAEWLEVK